MLMGLARVRSCFMASTRLLSPYLVAPLAALAACGGRLADLPADACTASPCDSVADASDAAMPDATLEAAVEPAIDASDTPDAAHGDTSPNDGGVAPGEAVPPGPPSTAATGGATRWFVVKKFLLGTELQDGTRSADAWQTLGYDLDGRDTTASDSRTNTNTCQRFAGSPSAVLADGVGGRDDNFGSHIMQMLVQLQPNAEDSFNQQIAGGGTTWLLRLDNVGAPDNANVPGALYETAPLGTRPPPRWDGTDSFPVLTTSLVDGSSLDQPKVVFLGGYMTGGTWVSGAAPMRAQFSFGMGSGSADLPIEGAIFSFPTSTTGASPSGVFAGVMRATAAQDALGVLAQAYGICPGGPIFGQMSSIVSQAVDLVMGAPQYQDVNVTCDSISIGLGLYVAPAQPPSTVFPPPPPPPSQCAPSGTGG